MPILLNIGSVDPARNVNGWIHSLSAINKNNRPPSIGKPGGGGGGGPGNPVFCAIIIRGNSSNRKNEAFFVIFS